MRLFIQLYATKAYACFEHYNTATPRMLWPRIISEHHRHAAGAYSEYHDIIENTGVGYATLPIRATLLPCYAYILYASAAAAATYMRAASYYAASGDAILTLLRLPLTATPLMSRLRFRRRAVMVER